MQFLIDSTQETPASLRFIAATLCALADTYGPPLESLVEAPSINGPQSPIVLHTHGPAAPIDAAVLAVPTDDPAQLDPATVFSRSVPAGTNAPLAPPAPIAPSITAPVPLVASPAFVAPAAPVPLMTPPAASAATTTAETSASAVSVVTLPSAPTATLERDSDGMPWDARVHSETRKTNADGTWRNRRNLDVNVKAAVMAELKRLYGGQLTTQTDLTVTAPQAPLPPAAPVIDGTSGQVIGHIVPPAPTAPVAPQPPVPVPNGVPVGLPNTAQPAVLPALGFRDFMSAVNKALTAGRLTQDQLTTACKAINLDGISALASEPGKISLVHSQIAHLLGAATA
jgi:hypothetical protein